MPELAVAECTVRRYVHVRKREFGLMRSEIFIPQSYPWGREAQVDWYEAWAELGGGTAEAVAMSGTPNQRPDVIGAGLECGIIAPHVLFGASAGRRKQRHTSGLIDSHRLLGFVIGNVRTRNVACSRSTDDD